MIYLSLTTIPSRIKYFYHFYNHIMNCSIKPDYIILNIYNSSLRNDVMNIPDDITCLPNLILKHHECDYGPILKFFGVFDNKINGDDIFIYCDDDLEYDFYWLENMIGHITSHSNLICSYALNSGVLLFNRLRYLKFNNTNAFVRGFGGVGFYKKTITHIDKKEIIHFLDSYEKKLSDDLILSYFFQIHNLYCSKIHGKIGNSFDYASHHDSISKGANHSLISNKKRYFSICTYDKKLAKCFNLYSYLLCYNIHEKDFQTELYLFKQRLLYGKHFSFVRFGDGEINILRNKNFSCPNFDFSSNKNKIFVSDFQQSVLIKNKNYFLGIPCSCCESKDKFRDFLFTNYDISKNQLTFANMFVNSNYYKFHYELLPVIKQYNIVLICNEKASTSQLCENGYHIVREFRISNFNAFLDYETSSKSIINYINNEKINNHIFLFCAGCLSNVLIQRCFENNPNNFYIDIGSALDNDLKLGHSRNYNRWFSWKILSYCYWNKKTNPFTFSCYSNDYHRFTRNCLKLIGFFYVLFSLFYYIVFYNA